MSTFKHHESCPRCGSRDNVGVWDDGHKWCFGCGYYVPPDGVTSEVDVKEWIENKKATNDSCMPLPADASSLLPPNVDRWLKGFGITDTETICNNFKWSPSWSRLIFPVYGQQNQLLMWQGRYFDQGRPGDIDNRRYFTAGHPEYVDHILYQGSTLSVYKETMLLDPKTVVVVEDMISALTVARLKPTLVLWGSNFSVTRMKRLSRRFAHLIFWLDADKHTYALRQSIKARPYFDHVGVVRSEKDPKFYNLLSIGMYLENANHVNKQIAPASLCPL